MLCENVEPSSSFSLFCIITAPATSHLNLQSQGQGLGSLLILKQWQYFGCHVWSLWEMQLQFIFTSPSSSSLMFQGNNKISFILPIEVNYLSIWRAAKEMSRLDKKNFGISPNSELLCYRSCLQTRLGISLVGNSLLPSPYSSSRTFLIHLGAAIIQKRVKLIKFPFPSSHHSFSLLLTQHLTHSPRLLPAM